jgi:hypothetical protein
LSISRLVLGLHDGGLPGVLGPLALRVLLGHRRRPGRLGLGDLRLPPDRGLVRRAHRVDVAAAHVVDRLDLQRVHQQADLGHLALGGVEHRLGQLLPLGDDLLDRHRADDRAQVAGEDPPGQHRHLVLVGQEALPGVDDGLRVVAHLERDNGLDLSGMACLVTQVSETSASAMDRVRNLALRKIGST